MVKNNKKTYQTLTKAQIKILQTQGCSAVDWSEIKVAEPFNPPRIRNVHFSGTVSIGRLEKRITLFGGIEKNTGIYNATIHNCRVGDNVYINNIENYIANYDIGDNVIIDHVALLAVEGRSSFGNGVEVAVINEVGGREVPIYDHLSSHVAYIIAMYRHRKAVIENLRKMIAQYVKSVASSTGVIGNNAKITGCGTLKNIKVGSYAVIDGASSLENGSINSCPEDPTFVGTDVIGKDFILCSGAKVSDGTIIAHCFVGQATELSKQYSAENSVFFANCGGFHGEACSIFAGPYTVTHHKSTLLIAGLFSFLNAGSGSNQSNHMYKLGPVHQGIVERGSKTTSDSYMLWPAKVGAFSLVMGRHYANSDTSDLPFSYLIEHEDESVLIPGVNLRSVGTIRDSQKWPKRDKRKDLNKFDMIIFDLLTPYTVQKIINGVKLLEELKETSGRTCQNYYYNGVKIKRTSLENGIDLYKMGVNRYLGNILVQHLSEDKFNSMKDIRSIFAVKTKHGKGKWLDLAGLLITEENIDKLLVEIEKGKLTSLDEVNQKLKEAYDNFKNYEKNWVVNVLEQQFGKPFNKFTPQNIITILNNWIASVEKLDMLRCDDAKKEFSATSRTGFGIDGGEAEKNSDFEAVRGTASDNSFVTELKERLEEKKRTAVQIVKKLLELD
jgi:hypothetical protein